MRTSIHTIHTIHTIIQFNKKKEVKRPINCGNEPKNYGKLPKTFGNQPNNIGKKPWKDLSLFLQNLFYCKELALTDRFSRERTIEWLIRITFMNRNLNWADLQNDPFLTALIRTNSNLSITTIDRRTLGLLANHTIERKFDAGIESKNSDRKLVIVFRWVLLVELLCWNNSLIQVILLEDLTNWPILIDYAHH